MAEREHPTVALTGPPAPARPTRGAATFGAGPSWELAAGLESLLGDPYDEDSSFSYRSALDRDRDASFPEAFCAALDRWGLPAYYVPAEYDGALRNYGELLQLLRVLARRDPSVTVAHCGTFRAAAPVWVSSDRAAARRLGALIGAGARVVAPLATSDAPAGGLTARPSADDYRVDGEEWLTGDAERCDFLCLLARTSPVQSPRAYSLLLVENASMTPDALRLVPAAPSAGLRGAGASGAVFRNAGLGADSVVGGEGIGTEAALKGDQVTSILRSAFSLGTAESALRMALKCADERILTSAERDLAVRDLAESYADLLLGEALSAVGVRSIHLLSGELSVTAAATSFLVPKLAAHVVERQARAHRDCHPRSVRDGDDGLWHEMLRKLERDHRAMGAALGGGAFPLHVLTAQFRSLARCYFSPPDHRPRLIRLFSLDQELPRFSPERLTLFSRHGSTVLGALPQSVARLRELAALEPALGGAAELANRLLAAADALHRRIGTGSRAETWPSPESHADAESYALCFAGAACVGLWLNSRETVTGGVVGLWRDGLWLEACLLRALVRLDPDLADPADDLLFVRLTARLTAQHTDENRFSLLPRTTAESSR